jgi:Ca2+-binding EF-hand superfamily protein
VTWLVPNLASKFVIVTSIEFMKDKQCCEDVIAAAKKVRLLESITILEMAKMEGKLTRMAGSDGTISTENALKYKERWGTFSAKKQADIMKTFAMFDVDNSGQIDREELGAVLSSLGFDETGVLVRSANKIMDMMDVDGNGFLDADEFKVLMAIVMSKDDQKQREEDCKALFNRFDEDESGEIEICELADAFEKLGVTMSEDSMGDLIHEVLGSFKQSLKEEDFVKFMEGLEDLADKD